MVDRHGSEVLNKSSASPDVERLDSEADREDRLIEIVGVLDQELVDVLASRVGRIALRDWLVAVLLRVDVRWRSWEQNTLAGVDQVGGLARRGVERYRDRLTPGAGHGLGVLGPRALVVLKVAGGRNGD